MEVRPWPWTSGPFFGGSHAPEASRCPFGSGSECAKPQRGQELYGEKRIAVRLFVDELREARAPLCFGSSDVSVGARSARCALPTSCNRFAPDDNFAVTPEWRGWLF